MAQQKWITLAGMVTVEQAKALRDVIDVGLDGVEDEQQHDCLLDMRERLNRAINHVEVEGFAGSGICVPGNEFVAPSFEELAGEHEDYSETIGIPGVTH